MAALPSADELKKLPLRALLAYAARCALRVQSRATPPSHTDAAAFTQAIRTAVEVTASYAAGETVSPDQALAAEEAAMQAVVVANESDNAAAALAANGVYAAINATRVIVESEKAKNRAEPAEEAVMAVLVCADSAVSADAAVLRAARLDWEMLHRMHLGRFPELGESIDPTEKGLLGPLFCAPRSGGNKKEKPPEAVHLEQLLARFSEEFARLQEARRQAEAATPESVQPTDPQMTAPPAVQGESDAAAAAQAAEELREKQNELRRRASELEQSEAVLTAEREKLRNDQEALSAERERLRHEQETLATERSQLEEQRANVSMANEELRKRLDAAEREQAELEQQRTALQAQRDQLQAAQDDLRTGRAAYANELAEMQAERARHDSEHSQLREFASELDAVLRKHAAALEHVEGTTVDA